MTGRHQSVGASAPADINAETYPFEVVQRHLDQAAYFVLYSAPAPGDAAMRMPDGGTTGTRVREVLHRFGITPFDAARAATPRVANRVGEPVATCSHRWVVISPDYHAVPGCDPPATRFDPARPQRFAMLDTECVFNGGRDRFRGFGTGQTFPPSAPGRGPLLAAAVGTILDGYGKFAGLEGTYTYCGSLDPQHGFRGCLVLRVPDPRGVFRPAGPFPPLRGETPPQDGAKYFLVRGQKRGKTDRTEYRSGPGGQVTGLNVTQELRSVDADMVCDGLAGPSAVATFGGVIGSMQATIGFNLFAPGGPGTAVTPTPFQSYNEFAFHTPTGGFDADGSEGRTFNLAMTDLPGQQALRFGGFGPVLNGRGTFAGAVGLMTDNSVVGIAPHALATLYLFRLDNPDGQFQKDDAGFSHPAAGDEGWGPSPPVVRPKTTARG